MISNRYIAALFAAGLVSSPALADESVYINLNVLYLPVLSIVSTETISVAIYVYDDVQPEQIFEGVECFADWDCNFWLSTNITTGVVQVSLGDYSSDMLDFLQEYCDVSFLSTGLAHGADICKSFYY